MAKKHIYLLIFTEVQVRIVQQLIELCHTREIVIALGVEELWTPGHCLQGRKWSLIQISLQFYSGNLWADLEEFHIWMMTTKSTLVILVILMSKFKI